MRYPQRLAAIVGLSGYLPLADRTAGERSAVNAGTPVFLAHGRHDPVVPIARGVASRDALFALGYPVEWHDYAMPHSVCPAEIDDLSEFIRRALPA